MNERDLLSIGLWVTQREQRHLRARDFTAWGITKEHLVELLAYLREAGATHPAAVASKLLVSKESALAAIEDVRTYLYQESKRKIAEEDAAKK